MVASSISRPTRAAISTSTLRPSSARELRTEIDELTIVDRVADPELSGFVPAKAAPLAVLDAARVVAAHFPARVRARNLRRHECTRLPDSDEAAVRVIAPAVHAA